MSEPENPVPAENAVEVESPAPAGNPVEAKRSAPVENPVADASMGRGQRKSRLGTVVSAKLEKSIVVLVERRVRHPVYNKFITVRKRYPTHDELGCKVGDRVRIRETRPVSKTKRWKVAQRLGQDGNTVTEGNPS